MHVVVSAFPLHHLIPGSIRWSSPGRYLKGAEVPAALLLKLCKVSAETLISWSLYQPDQKSIKSDIINLFFFYK